MKNKKITLFAGILIIIGQIIGIGLFLKNASIFAINDNNPYGILLSWLIGGLITLCIAFSIGKIANANQKKHEAIGLIS
jgi:amino acid transporter